MKIKKYKLILIIFILAAVSIGFWFLRKRLSEQEVLGQVFPIETIKSENEVFDGYYRNSVYGFSFVVPNNFGTREMWEEDALTVLVESRDNLLKQTEKQGVQIVVSDFGESLSVLSLDRVKKDIPDMKITDPKIAEFEVKDSKTGTSIQKISGLYFKSDNPAFDNKSAEIWFVYNQNLYQISTYEAFEDLMIEIFKTWKFTQTE